MTPNTMKLKEKDGNVRVYDVTYYHEGQLINDELICIAKTEEEAKFRFREALANYEQYLSKRAKKK